MSTADSPNRRIAPRRASDEIAAARAASADPTGDVLASLLDVVYSIGAEDLRLRFLNPAAERLYGHPVRAFFEDAGLWGRVIHPEDRRLLCGQSFAAAPDATWDAQYRILRSDGGTRWVHDRAYPVRNQAGRVARIDGVITDITRQEQQKCCTARANRICGLLGGIHSAMLRVDDLDTLFREICRIAVALGRFRLAWLGIAAAPGGGYTTAALATLDSVEKLSADFTVSAVPAFPLLPELSRDGRPYVCPDVAEDPLADSWRSLALEHEVGAFIALPLAVGCKVLGCLILGAETAETFGARETRLLAELAADVALALHHLKGREQRNPLALYDELTGLASRTLFLDRINQLIHRRSAKPFAVAVFDVDRFKHINETLTYRAGDHLLHELARRLSALAEENRLARPSGDDFALLLTDTGDETDIAGFLHDILLPAMTLPIHYEEQELRIALKLGVACFPNDGGDPETLLANAELAHRRAQNSKEPLLFFAEEMNQGAGEFLRVESKLRRASEHHEFVVHYQPKIDLREGRVCGVEALLRWRDPEDGNVPPDKFISVLEETGLILNIGRWLIEEAGCQFHRWLQTNPAPPKIAVNISPIQLSQRSFVADMEAALKVCEGHRGYLELEITESAIMHNVEENTQKLHAIREMGVEISIDDFGTGYSSLSYLTRLPLTRLKIDQSFIVRMTESPDSLSVVHSIISLAHTLNLKVAAEGVETAEQLKFLRLLRCDEVQGYLFSPPVAPDDVLRLQSRRW